MAAADPAEPDLVIEVQTLRDTLASVEANVTNLNNTIADMSVKMTGLLASGDQGVWGETYAEDSGPAVRAKMFEEQAQQVHELKDQVQGITAGMAEVTETFHQKMDLIAAQTTTLEGELRGFRTETGVARSSVPADRTKHIVTGTKGVEKLRTYAGDATQWPDWRLKITTWLAQINPSFETLMVKLDRSELEPKEPEDGERMAAGATVLTTEEEWCSEQLYQLLVQKCEGNAFAIVRNLNTKGKARGLIAWYRTLREAQGQVETKKQVIIETGVLLGSEGGCRK